MRHPVTFYIATQNDTKRHKVTFAATRDNSLQMDYHYLLKHIHDNHCHLSIDVTQEDVDRLAEYWDAVELNRGFFSLMSTNHIDLEFVRQLSAKPYVFPYYGIHPWFCHVFGFGDDKESHYKKVLTPEPTPELLEVLPEPINVEEYLGKIARVCQEQTEGNGTLDNGPHNWHTGCGIGEIGLDRLFRIPKSGFLGSPGPIGLSPCRTTLAHQEAILRLHLSLAQDLQLPVSVHCVKAHGAMFDIMKEYHLSKIILHSFSGSRDQAKLWIKTFPQAVFSVSNVINGKKNLEELLEVVGERFLMETDVAIDLERYEEELMGVFEKLSEVFSEEEVVAIVQR